ncbi:hypothetical protein [Rhodococcus jostii]|uniref:hypothetical protein n=1 Tax=Rhodococcus jostii TaxID=132919 RepID=UPI00362F31F5
MSTTWDRIEDVPEGVMVTDRDGHLWLPQTSLTPDGRAYINGFAPFTDVEAQS